MRGLSSVTLQHRNWALSCSWASAFLGQEVPSLVSQALFHVLEDTAHLVKYSRTGEMCVQLFRYSLCEFSSAIIPFKLAQLNLNSPLCWRNIFPWDAVPQAKKVGEKSCFVVRKCSTLCRWRNATCEVLREKYKHHNSLTIHSPGNEDEELALRFSCREIHSEASLKMQQEEFNEIKKAADCWR